MYDENIEKVVLYYLIFEKEELSLKEDDFFIAKNKQIYTAIKELKAKKEEINLISIKNKINEKDTKILEYICNIAENRYGSSLNYAYKELKRLSKERALLKVNKNIEKDINEKNIEDIEIYIEKQIKELKEINEEGQKEETFKDIVSEASDIITKKYLQKENYENKLTTGIFDLDKTTGGLHAEEFTVIRSKTWNRKNSFGFKNSTKHSK